MDPKEKEKLVDKQLAELREALKQKQEVINSGAVTGAYGYETTETYYDPHAQLTFGTGNYSNTVVGGGGGYTITSTPGLSSATGIQWTTGTTAANNPWATTATNGKLHIEGKDADIVINGVSLMEVLRDRLNVMIPNPELEKEWDQLRALGDQYRALEKELKEKGNMWSKLKAMPPL